MISRLHTLNGRFVIAHVEIGQVEERFSGRLFALDDQVVLRTDKGLNVFDTANIIHVSFNRSLLRLFADPPQPCLGRFSRWLRQLEGKPDTLVYAARHVYGGRVIKAYDDVCIFENRYDEKYVHMFSVCEVKVVACKDSGLALCCETDLEEISPRDKI